MRIAKRQQIVSESVDLVAKQNTQRKTRLPIEQVDRVAAGFDGRNLVILLPQTLDQPARIGRVVPGNGLLGAERGLSDGAFGRTPSDAAQVQFFAATPSAVRKNAPTLYMLRTLSSRIETGIRRRSE